MNQQKKNNREITELIKIRLPPLPKTPNNNVKQNQKKKKRKNRNNGTLIGVANNTVTRTNIPRMNGMRSFTISNREVIYLLFLPATFAANVLRLRINPGSGATFHWLNKIAVNFEKYRFKRIKIEYIPRQAVTQPGAIVMAPDYDAADQAYTSEAQIYAASGVLDGPSYEPLSLVLHPSLLNQAYKTHYVMSDTRFNSTAQDSKTIDAAAVQIGGESVPASYTGRLFVDYEVDLFTPQPPTEEAFSNGSNYIFNAVQNLSTAPITGPVTTQSPIRIPEAQIQDLGAILDTTKDGIFDIVYPTNKIGTFLKDFNGILNAVYGGTTFINGPNIQVNGVTQAILDGGVLNAVNGAIKNFKIIAAKKGDVLSFANDLSSATFTAARLGFGGNQWFI